MVLFKLLKKSPLDWKTPTQKRDQAFFRSCAAASASSGARLASIVSNARCSVSQSLAHLESAPVSIQTVVFPELACGGWKTHVTKRLGGGR